MKITKIAAMVSLATMSIGYAQAEDEKDFTMDGEFGFIVTTGNTETTSLSAGLSAKQELEQWSNDYAIEALYKKDTVTDDDTGEEVENTTAQKFFASGQANYKLENPDYRLFGFASYEDDRFSNFKYQSTVAAGWNHKVWQNQGSSFNYSIGPGYSFAKDQNDESVNGAILRAAADYKWQISETAKFTQTFSTEVGSDNTKTRAESALTAQIFGGLSMKLSIKFTN